MEFQDDSNTDDDDDGDSGNRHIDQDDDMVGFKEILVCNYLSPLTISCIHQ